MNHSSTDIDSFQSQGVNPFILTGSLLYCSILFFTSLFAFSGAPKDDTIPYETKYYDNFSKLDDIAMTEADIKNLTHNYVKEATDNDYDIIMNYGFETEAFQYWGVSNIPYTTLDSLAQLYAIENNCKYICADYASEITDATEKIAINNAIKESEPKSVKDKQPSNDSPFACFKKYNLKSSNQKKNSSIIPEKCNRFRRMGYISECPVEKGLWCMSDNSDTAKTCVWFPDLHAIFESVSYDEWKSSQK